MSDEPDLHSLRLPIGSAGHWLHVMEAGPADAPAILILHGAAGCWHNFFRQIRTLAGDFRLVAPDLRGHGVSPWPGPSSVEDFYADILEVVRARLPEKFMVLSHSFGGYLAARLAAEHPERVTRLALLNSGGHLPQGLVYRTIQLFCGHVERWTRYQPYNFSVTNEVAKYMLYRTVKGWNCWDCYARIVCPTLVVMGRFDTLVPVSFGQRMLALLPQGRLEILDNGGHVCMWESEIPLRGWLREFLYD